MEVGTAHLDHDGKLPKLSDKLVRLAIVNLVFQHSGQLATVGDMALSALSREDLAILGKLVAWRNLRFLERHTLVANGKLVPFGCWCGIVAIKICLCANLFESMVDEARLSIAGEEGVECLDVGVDRELEGRVCCSVGGWVSEEVLSACYMVLMIPRRICARRSHGDNG